MNRAHDHPAVGAHDGSWRDRGRWVTNRDIVLRARNSGGLGERDRRNEVKDKTADDDDAEETLEPLSLPGRKTHPSSLRYPVHFTGRASWEVVRNGWFQARNERHVACTIDRQVNRDHRKEGPQ
jgi:hypothetical protein